MPEIRIEKNPLTIGEGFLAFLLSPWVCAVALVGLLVGVLVIPPQGFTVSTCGMMRMMHTPCPGCGLTRSVSSVLHGRFVAAWEYNPFGYLIAGLFIVLGPMTAMPGRWRAALRNRLGRWGNGIAIAAGIILAGLIVHGVVRAALVMGEHPSYLWWKQGGPAPTLQREGIVPAKNIPLLWGSQDEESTTG